jgi:hypothetical protein
MTTRWGLYRADLRPAGRPCGRRPRSAVKAEPGACLGGLRHKPMAYRPYHLHGRPHFERHAVEAGAQKHRLPARSGPEARGSRET